MLFAPARRDGNQLRFLLRQHLTVVSVLPQRAAPLCRRLASSRHRVRDGDDLHARHAVEKNIQPVTVIPASRMTDDGRAQSFVRSRSCLGRVQLQPASAGGAGQQRALAQEITPGKQ